MLKTILGILFPQTLAASTAVMAIAVIIIFIGIILMIYSHSKLGFVFAGLGGLILFLRYQVESTYLSF